MSRCGLKLREGYRLPSAGRWCIKGHWCQAPETAQVPREAWGVGVERAFRMDDDVGAAYKCSARRLLYRRIKISPTKESRE